MTLNFRVEIKFSVPNIGVNSVYNRDNSNFGKTKIATLSYHERNPRSEKEFHNICSLFSSWVSRVN